MHEDSFGTKTARARINTCLHTCGWVYTKEKVVEAGEAEGGGGGGVPHGRILRVHTCIYGQEGGGRGRGFLHLREMVFLKLTQRKLDVLQPSLDKQVMVAPIIQTAHLQSQVWQSMRHLGLGSCHIKDHLLSQPGRPSTARGVRA